MSDKAKKVLYLLLSALITLFLYILLHELGHLIVMLTAGATITDFSILTAHVSAVGGTYSDLSDLWLHANGALLPVIVSFVYMLFYKKKKESPFYRIFSYIVSIAPTMSLLAWVIIPFIYLQGNAPVGEDVTKFLFNFAQNHQPLIVSAVAVLIIVVDVIVMVKNDIIKNAILIMRERV